MRIAHLLAGLVLLPVMPPVGEAAGLPAWQRRFAYSPEELTRLDRGAFGFAYLPATINGAPVRLVLDTGNMSGLLVAAGLADSLQLQVVGESRNSDADGRPISVTRRFAIRELRVLGGVEGNVEAVEDTRRHAQGFLGPRFLLGGRFTVDYRRGWLGFSRAPTPDVAGGTRLPLISSDRYPGMPVVRGTANGVPVLIQIDTGKSRTCVDPRLVEQLALRRDAHGVRGLRVTLGRGEFAIPSAKEVGFGGISDGYATPILVGVGVDLLSRLLVTVDYVRGIVILTPN